MTKLLAKSFLFCVILLWMMSPVLATSPEEAVVFDNAPYNQQCFKCHGQKTYHYFNESADRVEKDRMNPYFIVDSVMFYQSNHATFMCTDCHSPDYETFPHPGELRMEQQFACMDCHGGDDTYAEYQFERIEEEFQASVHSNKHSEDFTVEVLR